MKLKKLLVVICLTSSSIYSSIFAQSIFLDSSFATNGKVTTDINNLENRAACIKTQSDNKIVVAGTTYNGNDYDFALVRYNYDGSLDPSFGNGGKVITNHQGKEDRLRALSIASDQKILAAGYVQDISGILQFGVNRYNPNGSLDLSFGNMGKVITTINNTNCEGYALTIQSDDKILVAGLCYSGPNGDFGIARYHPNGSLDNSFNSTGIVTIDFGGWYDVPTSILVHPNGKIMVSGSCNGNLLLARLNSNGSLDSSFAANGKLILNSSAISSAMAIQPDGKILIAGNYLLDISLTRLSENGILDSTFSSDGIAVVDVANNSPDRGSSLAIQNDGKIIVTGQSYVSGSYSDFVLLRFNTDGSLDSTTSPTGKIITDFSGYNDWGYATTIQNDGKILVAGEAGNLNTGYDFAVARYIDPQLVTNVALNSTDSIKVGLSPNPFTDQITASTSGNEPVIISFFNFSGQKIFQRTFTNSITINTDPFKEGIYFYELRSEKGLIKAAKIIKQ